MFLRDMGSQSEDKRWKKSYDPYEQDLFNFPDSQFCKLGFKIYGENFEYYEQAKARFESEDQSAHEFGKDRVPPATHNPGTANTINDFAHYFQFVGSNKIFALQRPNRI